MNLHTPRPFDQIHAIGAYWQPPLLPGLIGGRPRSAKTRLRSWSLWPTIAMFTEAVDTAVNDYAALGHRSLGRPRAGGEGEW